MPGGKIPPDGRTPVAPGVGKTARRHDLEAQPTPGLSDPSMQQGDVQRLEQSQKIAPRPKRTQPAAAGQPSSRRRQGVQRGSDQFALATPDPIEMASSKIGGEAPGSGLASTPVYVDPAPWMPLLEQMASSPNAGGGMTSAFVEQLANFRRQPISTAAYLIDLNEADEALGV